MAVIPTNNPRELPWPAVAYIAKRFQHNTPGIGVAQTVVVGNLPAGAIITKALAVVHTVFNAVSSNVVLVGTSTMSEIFTASTGGSLVTEGTTGAYPSAAAIGQLVPDGGEVVYVQYTQTGTAATTGDCSIIIEYVTRVS